jgi:dTDP-4-amino-4,6-dideoxygalactose transaminase
MYKIPLIKPYITDEVKQKVCEVLDNGYLTEGPITKEFEEAFKRYIGCRHAIAVTSCTTGLEMALRAMNIGLGDEVIVPDYTYPATADVVAIVGATTVIVDVTKDTMLIDYNALEQAITPRTKAVIPVSIFGNPLDYARLFAIKKKHRIYIIEDAACAIGAEYKGVKVGNTADISVFSLHPRKFITTGEGGLITTSNDTWAAWLESYKHFGMSAMNTREGAVFLRIGTNYKLSNILAAVGLVQMRHIDELLNKRRELSGKYKELLKGVDNIQTPQTTAGGKHSYQSFCIFVDNRDGIIKQMREEGIEVQIGTYALHMHPAFAEGPHIIHHGSFDGSHYAFDHCLTLPLYHEMKMEDQDLVINKLSKAAKIN